MDNFADQKKKLLSLFLVFILVLNTITSAFLSFNFKTLAQGDRDAVEHYGITDVRLDEFRYYEIENTTTDNGDYHNYGAGLHVDWNLPAEAKKGDYFTLKLPPEINIDKSPLYKTNETVPYDKLDDESVVGDKYSKERVRYKLKDEGLGKRNVFFVINDKKTGKPLLNVYNTKKGELTFVAQDYVNEVPTAIKGTATIGRPVDKNRLNAFTDKDLRYYKTGKKVVAVGAGSQSLLDSEQREDNSKFNETYYTGISPVKTLLNTDNGTYISSSNKYHHTKLVSFETQYKTFKKFTIPNKPISINYRTEMFKAWSIGQAAASRAENNFGNESLQVVDMDDEYVYYNYVYGAKSWERPTTNQQTFGPHTIIIGGIANQAVASTPQPQDLAAFYAKYRFKGFMDIDRDSVELYAGYNNEKDPKNVNSFIPTGLRRIYIDNQNVEFKYEDVIVNTTNNDYSTGNLVRENIKSFVFRPAERDKTYFIKFRAKKKAPIDNNTGERSDYMAMVMAGNTAVRYYQEFFRPTSGRGIGDFDYEEPPYVAQPSLKLVKTDTNGRELTRQAGEASPVEFKATDLETGVYFVQGIDENGVVEFKSLIRNHSYKLEEIKADAPFKLSDKKYLIEVDENAKLKIFSYDNETKGEAVSENTRPLSLKDRNDARFTFSNSSNINLKIKKIDSSNKIVTGSEALFHLYAPGKYNVVGNTVEEKDGELPTVIKTVFNGRYGTSNSVELAPSDEYYALKEVKAPDGTKLIDGFVEFRVNADGTISFKNDQRPNFLTLSSDGYSHEFTVTNEKTTKFILDKVNERDEKLNGVRFELTNERGESFNPRVIVNSQQNGEVLFEGLTSGVYKIKEIETLPGYSLLDYDIKLTVNQDLTVTTEKISKATGATLRTAFRSVSNSGGNLLSVGTLFNATYFRSAGEDRSANPMPQPPYGRNDNPSTMTTDETMSYYSINNNIPVVTTQNITPTNKQGEYRVDVDVSGSGIANEGSVFVFAIEKSKWMDSNTNFREILRDSFNKIRDRDPNARVGVITSTENASEEVIPITDINTAINNINNVYDLTSRNGGWRKGYYDGYIKYRNFANVLRKAVDFFKSGNNASARNKYLIQFLSTGTDAGENGRISGEISDKLDNLKKLGVSHTIVYNGSWQDPAFMKEKYAGANVETYSGNDSSWTNAGKKIIDKSISKIKLGPGNINITLNTDKVEFLRFGNGNENGNVPTSNLSHSNGVIKATNLIRRFNLKDNNTAIDINSSPESHRFSYYIRSKDTNLNEWSDIASSSNYKKYANRDELALIPIPEVLNPGITVNVNKTYTPGVPVSLKANSTFTLSGGNISKEITVKEGAKSFDLVPKFDREGNDIIYTVTEKDIQNGLTSTINPTTVSGGDRTVNVVHDLKPLKITVTKQWRNIPEEHKKDVKVKLKAFVNGVEVTDNAKLTELGVVPNNVERSIPKNSVNAVEFTNLKRRDSNGDEVVYSIEEYESNGTILNKKYLTVDYDYGTTTDDNVTVNITDSGYSKLRVVNKKTGYPIKIRKIDTAGNKLNSFTRFVIKSSDTEGERDVVNIGGNQSAEFENGEFVFNPRSQGFPPGVYYIREITAPSGYKVLNRNIKVEITAQGAVKVDNEDITRGSAALDRPDLKVSQDNDGTIVLEVKNKKLFNLHIKKRVKSEVNALGTITSSDQLDGNLVRLRAVFNLVKENGANNWENVRQDIATEDGYASLPNLEEGKYRLVETTAPNGYYRLNDPIEFTVDSSGITVNRNSENAVAFKHNNSTTELVVAVKNEPLKYKFKVRKIGKGNDTLIGNQDLNRAARISVFDDRKVFIPGEVANLTSGEQIYQRGGAKYAPGIYYLKEERAPEGYDRLTKLIKIEITNTGKVNFLGYENENDRTTTDADNMVTVSKDTNDPELITINISNTKIFNMTFQKIDATKKGEFNANNNNLDKSLAGAKIKIRPKVNDGNSKIVFDNDDWNRDNMNGEYSQTDGGVVWVSKNNNIPGFRLTEGTYIAEEIEAPNGFEKFSPFEIVVSSTGQVSIQSNNNPQGNISVGVVEGRVIIHAVDPTSMYDIKLLKVDKENSETTLANSRFKISKDSAGNTEAEEKNIANVVIPMLPDGTVNNNGENYWADSFNTDRHHNYSGYGVGLYYLTETQAPNGYKGLEESVPFYINSNGTVTIPAKLQDGRVVFVNGVAEKDTASKYADFFEVEVRNDYKWAPKKLIVIKAKNEKNSISIKLKKVLENNENTTIDGVKFKLFSKHQTENKPDENKPYGDPNGYTTADGGIITIPNISQGEYFLKETEVPSVNDRNRPTAEYKLNEKYYKIIVAQDGTVTFGDKALVKGQNDVYTEVDVDDKLVLGTKEDEDNIQNVTFKNEVRYRVSLEKDLYFTDRKLRVSNLKFYIKPKDDNAKKIELVELPEYKTIGKGFTVLTNRVLHGVTIPENAIAWNYDRFSPAVNDKLHLHNPIFSLSPGNYIVEELNPSNGFEKVKFELTVGEDGRVGIVGFEDQTSDPALTNYGFADGNIFWIRQDGTPGTNSSTIHIHNKTPMEMYLKKVDQKGTRINVGKLKLKLEGANVFDKDGQKTDEITLDLARDYVEGKGLKIVIPKEIKTGTYILTEEEAPVGYQKTNKRYHIEIDQFMRTIKLIKTDDGVGNDGVVKNEVLTRPEKVLYREEFNGRNTRDFLNRFTNTEDIVNKKSEYPYTGGMGGLGYILLGTALMSVSVISIRKRYR